MADSLLQNMRDEELAAWKEGYWAQVEENLPPDLRFRARELRETLEQMPPRASYHPEVIYHRAPAEVADLLAKGGYQNMDPPRREQLQAFLESDEDLKRFVMSER